MRNQIAATISCLLLLGAAAPGWGQKPPFKLPPPVAKVEIQVDSVPPGAEVYAYDGRNFNYVTRTPGSVLIDPTASMTFHFKLDGFAENTASTGVTGDPKHPLQTHVSVSLSPTRASTMLWYEFHYHPAAAASGCVAVLLLLGGVTFAVYRRVRHLRQEAAAAQLESSDLVGRLVGDYHVQSLLGEGAFSRVYLVEHQTYGDRFAMKVLKTDYLSDDVELRFSREMEMGRDLIHKNLVRVYAFGDVQGGPYLVMEFLDGQTLRARLDQGRPPWDETVRILKQICDGLALAHSRGIVHRDLKPENIMICKDGSVRVMDFGIAKMLNRNKLTATGMAMGTPRYMSPEHLQSQNMDVRSDIYSLGVILFEMLSGRPPFEGDDPIVVVTAHVHSKPPRLASLDPTIPSDLEAIAMRMLEKNPAQRFQSVTEITELLSQTSPL